MYELKDSGSRQEFPTGAHRDTDIKTRPDLMSPYALYRTGEWLLAGINKYGERNWELGIPISRFVASLERHLLKYKMGMQDEDHLAAIMFNVQAIMHFEELAKRGDSVALAQLDDYASKQLALSAVERLLDGETET